MRRLRPSGRWGALLAAIAVAAATLGCSSNGAGAASRHVKRVVRPSTPSPCPGCWRPPLRLSWQIQFTGTLDTGVDAQVFDLDGFDTSAGAVSSLHAQGRKVICYVNAGAYEEWRSDAGEYPAAVLGAALDGWLGERWLDVREISASGSALARILRARIDMCARKGFDAIDFDNVDGYANASGFPLTATDQLTFNRWLAGAAHAAGLAAALKNDLDQVPALVGDFDFAVNEQCHEFGECDRLLPFVAAGKPVLQIEYSGNVSAICATANRNGFNAIKKTLALDATRTSC